MSAPVWDALHVKALLGLPRCPLRLLQVEPWHTWLAGRGGVRRVRDRLRDAPLTESQRAVLDVILAQPGAIADRYAAQLALDRSTYFARLGELLPALVQWLNAGVTGPAHPPSVPKRRLAALPVPATALIGREDAAQVLVAQVQQPNVRLLTVTGPGGVGKTRLALHVAQAVQGAFADGVAFVVLDDVDDPARVGGAIAAALGVATDGPVDAATLAGLVGDRALLVVLDNLEHLRSAFPLVSALLARCPRLTLLVTSRATLQLYGEHVCRVPPLLLPPPEAAYPEVTAAAAVQLFAARAQAADQDFQLTPDTAPTVAAICRRLDGLPLAIELAAARVAAMPLAAILAGVQGSLNLLAGGPCDRPARQQALAACIAWSFDRLPRAAQQQMQTLAGLGPRWTLREAAGALGVDAEAAATGVIGLVNQSVVVRHATPEGSFGMLTTIRMFAAAARETSVQEQKQ